MDIKRFNRPDYKQQIHAVRNYRRRVIVPRERQGFLKAAHALYLDRLAVQIGVAAAVALFVYLSYFAKFLLIKDFRFEGADPNESEELLGISRAYVSAKSGILAHIFPQKNILYFNGQAYTRFVTAHDPKILSVTAVHKRLPNVIMTEVIQRVPKFILNIGGSYYIVDSHGDVSFTISAPDPNMPAIIDIAQESFNLGDNLFDSKRLDFLDYINANFQSRIGVAVDHYEIAGKDAPDLTLASKNGFKIYFDTSADPKVSLDHLFNVWAIMTPDQRAKLLYFDARFDSNIYGCYKGTKCDNTVPAQAAPMPSPASPAINTPNAPAAPAVKK